MKQMFQSATLKLTAWYLLILMSISVLFSLGIYQLSTRELSARIDNIQARIESSPSFNIPTGFLGQIQLAQEREARQSIAVSLLYLNIFILVVGGLGSYILARRTLIPIEEAHEAQARFVSDASHELRTPLAVMKAELEASLRDPKLSKAEMRELLESNLEEVDTLTNLSRTLLQLSRLEDASIEMAQINLSEVAGVVAERYDKKSKRLKIRKNSRLKLQGNRASLEELLTILIDNALKYSPENSPVDIWVDKKGKFARFAITNTGSGISADDLPHIFDRFYRADSSRTGQGGAHGYGLGLSLARKIVELHQGELTVTSAPGELTTFTVLLPLRPAA